MELKYEPCDFCLSLEVGTYVKKHKESPDIKSANEKVQVEPVKSNCAGGLPEPPEASCFPLWASSHLSLATRVGGLGGGWESKSMLPRRQSLKSSPDPRSQILFLEGKEHQ